MINVERPIGNKASAGVKNNTSTEGIGGRGEWTIAVPHL